MRDDIKKRIEVVRRGEVPEGYCSGTAGVLPADWAAMPMPEISVPITEQVGNRAIETLSISAGIGFVNQAEKFGKELSGKQYEKYIVLRKGDFAYNKGNSKLYPQGCTYMLREREEAAVPNVFECFRFTQGNFEYYEQLFKNGFLNRQLTRKINHGVRDDGLLNLTDKDFYSTVLPVPPIEEQQRIAKILSACDRAIELKQKLVEELQQLKKTCLAKMFPQKGCVTPEIRFPGFTVPWNLCKIGTLCDEFRSGDFIKAESIFEDGAYPVYGGNGVRGYTDSYNHDGDYAIIGRQGALCGNVNYVTGKAYFTEHAVAVKANQANETRFLFYCFSNMNLRQFSDQSAQPGLAVNKLVKLETMIPSKAEQEQISAFLTSLDSTIILNKRELEEIQQKKKALMQLLLTGLVRVNV